MTFDPKSISKNSRDPQRLRAELQARLDALDTVGRAIIAIRDEFIKHPDLLMYFEPSLRAILAEGDDEESRGASAPVEAEVSSTTLDRIIQFFALRLNRSATMAEVLEGVEGNPVSIKQTLYKRHKEKFTFQEGIGGKRLWQLSPVMWDSDFDCLNKMPETSEETTDDIPF